MPDAHTPTYTQDGPRFTFDAQLIKISPAPPMVEGGTAIDHTPDHMLFTATPQSPLTVTLERDVSYDLVMQGYPDDLANPDRQSSQEVISFTMTEDELIREAIFKHLTAMNTLMSFDLTPEKLSSALGVPL